MPIYKVTGTTSDNSTIYIIDEDTDALETYQYFDAGAYEISNLANGTKIVVSSMSDGNSLVYGGVVPTETSGDSNSTGADGALVVDSGDVTVNDYTNVTSVGVNNVTVVSSSAFVEDEEVFIIQSQSTGGTVGNWETKRIANVNGTLITFTESLENSYSTAGDDVIQAIRVPNYTSVNVDVGNNIICPAWDGSVGGVIFFRAQGLVTLDGGVLANNKGFRGGPAIAGNSSTWGYRGESTLPNSYSSLLGYAFVPSGGGGGGWSGSAGSSTPDGGAGGGHGTAGGNGRHDGAPQHTGAVGVGGPAYGVTNLDDIYFGSAGGNSYGSTGGKGGGAIIISANKIDVAATGSINAGGQTGWDFTGSGAGGTLWLQATILDIGTNLIKAAGGSQSAWGGSGGDGRIRLDYTTINGSTNNPTPGYTGSY